MLKRFIIVISTAIGLAGCQSMTSQEQTTGRAAGQDSVQQQFYPAKSIPAEKSELPPRDLWERVRRELTWQSIHNSQIGSARDSYLRQPDYLTVVSERASLYLFYIVEEVERRGLPMELALLPLVESTLNPFATSSERAAGLWQIMPATGRYLGIENDWWYDGRRDLRESTRVALDYLEALHSEFDDDWMLALAAYNSGKGRVGRARRANAEKGLATDYWSLKLPRETRHYVPRLIALTQIIAFPEAFALDIPEVANHAAFEIANTGGQIELSRAAELAGIDTSIVRALNPGQLRWATSPEQAPELLLPPGTKTRFAQGVAQLTPDDRVRWQHYRIESGDNLIYIARKFNTEVGLLRQVNGVRGSMIRAGDTLMIPMGSAWASSLAMASSSAAETTRRGYRVRSGDSLYRIAGRFNVSINDILAWNSLKPGDYLQPGQKLTLYVNGG